jgi:peptidoglycan/LPS O-acetylase OafA/YrhL
MTTPPISMSQSDRKDQDNRLLFLDGLRGLAAFYVLVFHARWLLWEGYVSGYATHPEQYSIVAKVLVYILLLFSYGHEMVMLFFVLSGFVIHLRYAKRLKQLPNMPFDWGSYMLRRIRRLYPPLIFAMILTFALDQLGQALHFSIYFEPTVLNMEIKPVHDPTTAIGNLLFTMAVYVAPFGMNGALWSLAYEWWFYMIYPVFWRLSRRSMLTATAIMVVMYLMSFFPPLWPVKLLQVIFSLMVCWWFGVLLADIYVGRWPISMWKLAPLSLLFVGLVPVTFLAPAKSPGAAVILETLWALAFTGLLAASLAWQNRGGSLRFLEWLKPLGDMSYTLYVIHFPILIFISGWLISQSPTGALPQNVGWTFVGIGVCLCVAYAAHFFTESPFVQRRPKPLQSIPVPEA